MEQQIINNAHLMIGIQNMFRRNNQLENEFIEYCKKNDVCVGIISKIKVSPYYFNEKGKKLCYLFLEIETGKSSPILQSGKKVVANVSKNKMSWGDS